ncbi:MAG TPA: endolytic transglycosylase MltG [Ornithinibacter sp.]|nr:endolytic transglycosylase MltG [Ornithinibacter sp.]
MTQRDVSHTIFGEPEPPLTRRRAQRHRHRPQRKKRRWLVLLIALVLVGGAAWAAVSIIKPMVASVFSGGSETADFPGPGEGTVEIVVTPGESGEDIATTLREAGVVKTRGAYIDVARADPDRAAAIQPGKYALLKGMTAADAFAVLADPANRIATGTTVREGLWASETFAVLSKATGIPVEEYAAAAKDPEAIGLPAEAEGNVEGWLAPSTYEFPDDSTAAEQLATMVAQTVKVLDGAGVDPGDRKDVLILASLVEAEAKLDEDRPKIARVFLNRIETEGGPAYGLLQSDAAVSYGAQRRALFPTKAELEDASNPYNTRLIPGLPPGPISNPGAASITAAANPADGPWFFFVAVNPITGETKYAVTLDEHNANVLELNAYCEEKPKDCGQ